MGIEITFDVSAKWEILRAWLETDKKNGMGHKVNRALFLMDELDNRTAAPNGLPENCQPRTVIFSNIPCAYCQFIDDEGGQGSFCEKCISEGFDKFTGSKLLACDLPTRKEKND